jgi:hypothetical protein
MFTVIWNENHGNSKKKVYTDTNRDFVDLETLIARSAT